MLSKIWVWDPGPEKTYSGPRIQGSKRHRIPDLDPQHWFSVMVALGVRNKHGMSGNPCLGSNLIK
jgi:hypothetical protein